MAVRPSSTSATARIAKNRYIDAADAPVGEPSADEVADRHAESDHDQHQRHELGRQSRDVGRERCDIAVDGEEPAEADRADAEGEPDLGPREGSSSRAIVARVARLPRHREQRWPGR